MLVYVSIILNVYLSILNYMYVKREKYGADHLCEKQNVKTEKVE